MSEKPKRVRLVSFDLGGVLVRICRGWEEGCAAAGIDPDRSWRPGDSDGRHRELVAAYTIGAIDTATFFARLERCAGGVYSAAEFRRIHQAWLLGVYDGVESLLDDLHEAGAATACLSNTNEVHWSEMLDWPALRLLDHRFASHLIGSAKPDVEAYTALTRELRVEPGEIVFFDDLEENILSAQRLGWSAVRVDYTGDTVDQIRQSLTALGL